MAQVRGLGAWSKCRRPSGALLHSLHEPYGTLVVLHGHVTHRRTSQGLGGKQPPDSGKP